MLREVNVTNRVYDCAPLMLDPLVGWGLMAIGACFLALAVHVVFVEPRLRRRPAQATRGATEPLTVEQVLEIERRVTDAEFLKTMGIKA